MNASMSSARKIKNARFRTFHPNRFLYVFIGNEKYEKNPAYYCEDDLPAVNQDR